MKNKCKMASRLKKISLSGDISITKRYFVTKFLNQACTGRRPAGAWFLKIVSVQMSACVFVHVSAPRLLITSGMMWCDMDPIRLVKQVLQLFYGNYSHYH